MNEVCDILRPKLQLYAEGELCDARAHRRVERHLGGCADCRAWLADYEAFSRKLQAVGGRVSRERRDSSSAVVSILSTPTADDDGLRRVDRIMDLVAAAPAPTAAARSQTTVFSFMRLAAAVLVVASLAAAWIAYGRLGGNEGERGELAEGGRRVSRTVLLEPPELATAAPTLAELQWVSRTTSPSRGSEMHLFSRVRAEPEHGLALWVEVLDRASFPRDDAIYVVPLVSDADNGEDDRFSRGDFESAIPGRIGFFGTVTATDLERLPPRGRRTFRVVPANGGARLAPRPVLNPAPAGPWLPWDRQGMPSSKGLGTAGDRVWRTLLGTSSRS